MKTMVEFFDCLVGEKCYLVCDADIEPDCIFVADLFMEKIANLHKITGELAFDGNTVFFDYWGDVKPAARILRIVEYDLETDHVSVVWSHTENSKTLF